MARQPAWLTDLVPTLEDDGLDTYETGSRDHTTTLASNPVSPRAAKPSKTRKSQRPQGQTQARTHASPATANATARATLSAVAKAAVSVVPAPAAAIALTGATVATAPAAATAPAVPASAPASASASAPTATPAAALPPTSHRSRAADRRTRNISVVSDNLDASEYVNLDLTQLHVDSDSDDFEFRPPHRTTAAPSHSRSMSNPFPSLFSPKKKRHHRGDSPPSLADFTSSGRDETLPPLPARLQNKQQTLSEIGSAFGSGNGNSYLAPSPAPHSRQPTYSTGPCITCGSLMRWARGVEAFRCGICMTVNDLVPAAVKSSAASKPFQEVHESGDTKCLMDLKPQSASAGPISIEETRIIIDKCIRSYLAAVLCDVPTKARGPAPRAETHQPWLQSPAHGDAQTNLASASATRSLTGNISIGRPYDQSSALFKGKGRDSTHDPKPAPHEVPRVSRHSRSFSSTHMPYDQRHHQGFSQLPATIVGASPPSFSAILQPIPAPAAKKQEDREAKRIFRPLEDYIISHIFSIDCLDSSFLPVGHVTTSDGFRPKQSPKYHQHQDTPSSSPSASAVPEKDSKYGESSWWSSAHSRIKVSRNSHLRQASEGPHKGSLSSVPAPASRPIVIDWDSVEEWYDMVTNSGATWELVYTEFISQGKCTRQPRFLLEQIEAQILKGQEHAQRMLLKAVETVLKRPGRRISESGDFRFLIIVLANPLLHASCKPFRGNYQHDSYAQHSPLRREPEASRGTGPAAGQHSVIIKRILGLMSNSSDDWHSRMISCFSRFSECRFHQTKDLVGGFLAYRLVRYNEKNEEKRNTEHDSDPLVPKVTEGASAASFHAALNQATGSNKKPKQPTEKKIAHGDDWQIKAAVRVLGLLFAANNLAISSARRSLAVPSSLTGSRTSGTSARARLKGQIVPTSDFYITLLDNSDLVADFEAWEQQTAKFNFCQYPFLLSVWAKIQILEYEAHRQMKNKARDAFFDSIMTRRNFDQHLILNVRRDCLVEDSLKGVSAAIGSGTEDIKKGLRIVFNGEEGIDAGGLRKEWFLLLVREVFNPDHGMFVYDEESRYCYFNPASFETSDQFFLVGVVLGLAIYNSTILDVALPPFAFRKLLLAAPSPASGPGAAAPRPSTKYTLADLAEYRPSLAKGLQQLLDFEGDVENTFCLDFTLTIERYGHTDNVSLFPGGETRAVTNANREEYVDLYVRYLLDTAVFRQFEPFKRGFFTVCGCNALGLFRPEEIELLVRGSDEPLDVASLRLAASYENWPSQNPLEDEPTIKWLWELLLEASPQDQRKLLIFITGSDRIPATGPASLSIRVMYLGNDTGRFPTARTCFNTLTLYRYASKESMRDRLWGAVNESEGFGLK